MEIFRDRDDDYARWRATNPRGYVVSTGPNRPPTLHRADCVTLRPARGARAGSATRLPKACATDRGDLEAWARAEGLRLLPCTTCARRGAKPGD